MSKANDAALKAYPKRKDGRLRNYSCTDDDVRKLYAQGYRKAEKDLALTWEDVKKVEDLCMEVTTFFAVVGRNKVILEPPFYEEVARRFNEQREKK